MICYVCGLCLYRVGTKKSKTSTDHEFIILDFQQLTPCTPSPWQQGEEKEREGGSGCLHLFGTSVAVSMVMVVKIVGISQRLVQCAECC